MKWSLGFISKTGKKVASQTWEEVSSAMNITAVIPKIRASSLTLTGFWQAQQQKQYVESHCRLHNEGLHERQLSSLHSCCYLEVGAAKPLPQMQISPTLPASTTQACAAVGSSGLGACAIRMPVPEIGHPTGTSPELHHKKQL